MSLNGIQNLKFVETVLIYTKLEKKLWLEMGNDTNTYHNMMILLKSNLNIQLTCLFFPIHFTFTSLINCISIRYIS